MAYTREVNGKTPSWGKRCYLADNATLAGDIEMGDDCSVWFGAVLRADVDAIRIGNRVNIQDCACLHQTGGSPVVLHDDVSIGHGAVVHACIVEEEALVVGKGAVVAAGAVVLAGTKIPPYEIWAGIPARKVKDAAEGQSLDFARHYMDIKEWYR